MIEIKCKDIKKTMAYYWLSKTHNGRGVKLKSRAKVFKKAYVSKIEKGHTIKSTNLAGVMRDNGVDKIDLVFANAEGIEIMLLKEVSSNKVIRDCIPQLCLSMHERIVGKDAIMSALNNVSKFYSFKQVDRARGATKRYVSHLFRRKDLIT